MIKTLCIFCGSSVGRQLLYADQAAQLARHLVTEKITLVYGGANVGLMGILADTMLIST
jgi:hypothetical protein